MEKNRKKIKVFYHADQYDQKFSQWDAVGQEIKFLAEQNEGAIFTRQPSRKINLARYIFRLPYLVERIYCRKVFAADKSVNLHHVFNPRLKDFRYLRHLTKPIVYSVVAKNMGCASPQEMVEQAKKMNYISYFAVACESDKQILGRAGIKNVKVILPGINVARFAHLKKFSHPPQNLLAGTSPLSPSQLETRGIKLILDVLSKIKDLKIIFLWREKVLNEMNREIKTRDLEKQAKVVNQLVKPEKYLAQSAGAIAVFKTNEFNKAYPNSLIESLAARRPVIASDLMPIAKIIEKYHCGIVVKPDPDSLTKGIQDYFSNYQRLSQNCRKVVNLFSQERFLKDYREIYREVLR